MKKKILLSLVLGALTAFSDTATLTESVAVRLAVPAPLLTVFVSYPGKIGNQCGVKLIRLDETIGAYEVMTDGERELILVSTPCKL